MTTTSFLKRDILVSVRPMYAAKLLKGEKTVELRRRFPETVLKGTVIWIYSSSPICAIVAHARIKKVSRRSVKQIWTRDRKAACISKEDFDSYFHGIEYGYAIHLENIKPLKQVIEADYLQEEYGIIPPQSFRYLGDEYGSLLNDERFQTPNRYQRRHRT